MKPLVITALYDIGRSEWKDFAHHITHTYIGCKEHLVLDLIWWFLQNLSLKKELDR